MGDEAKAGDKKRLLDSESTFHSIRCADSAMRQWSESAKGQ